MTRKDDFWGYNSGVQSYEEAQKLMCKKEPLQFNVYQNYKGPFKSFSLGHVILNINSYT